MSVELAQENFTRLPINKVRTDGGTQPRAEMNKETILDYAQQMEMGAFFPPVIVFYDGTDYWLADGFHRFFATKQVGRDEIEAKVLQGTGRDAVLYSVGANATHGLRRTNADKRRAVETLLRDREWGTWSDRDIAKRCNVDHKTVGSIRAGLSLGNFPSEENNPYNPQIKNYITKHGTVASMNTSNIGHEMPLFPFQKLAREELVQEDEEIEETEEDRYVRAVDTGTIDYYHNDLRREAFARDKEEQETKSVPRGVPTALLTSETNEWFTPYPYVNKARELMEGIDVDPASNAYANEKVVQAATYYDIQTNGLNKEWHGRVWLNPPYGRDEGGSNQEAWSRRLIEQFEAGNTKEAVLLVNANTEAKWFQPLYDYPICFTNHRIRFYNTEGTPSQPTQGNAFIYFGKRPERFAELFSTFGVVIRRIDK